MALPNPNTDGTASIAMMQLSFQETSTNYLQGIFEGVQSLKTIMSSMRISDNNRAEADDRSESQQRNLKRRQDEENRRESRLSRLGGGLKQAAVSVKNTGKDLFRGFSMGGLLSTLIGGAVLAAIFAPDKSRQLMIALEKGMNDLMNSEFFKEVEKAAKGIFKEFGWDNLLVAGIFGWRIGAIYAGLKYVGSLVKTWLGISSGTGNKTELDPEGDGKVNPKDKTWIDENFTKLFAGAGLAALLFGPTLLQTLPLLLKYTLTRVALIPAMMIGIVKIAEFVVDEWNKSITEGIASGKHVSALKEATAKMAKTVLGDLNSGPAMIGAIAGAAIGIIGGPVGILLGSAIGLALGAGLNILFKSEEEIRKDNKIKEEFWDALFDTVGDSIINLLTVISNSIGEYLKTLTVKIFSNLPDIAITEGLLENLGMSREEFNKKAEEIELAEKRKSQRSAGGAIDMERLKKVRAKAQGGARDHGEAIVLEGAKLELENQESIIARLNLEKIEASPVRVEEINKEIANRLSFVNTTREKLGKDPFEPTPLRYALPEHIDWIGDMNPATGVDKANYSPPTAVVPTMKTVAVRSLARQMEDDAANDAARIAAIKEMEKEPWFQQVSNWFQRQKEATKERANQQSGDGTSLIEGKKAKQIAESIATQVLSANQVKPPVIVIPPAPALGRSSGDTTTVTNVTQSLNQSQALAVWTNPHHSIGTNLAN